MQAPSRRTVLSSMAALSVVPALPLCADTPSLDAAFLAAEREIGRLHAVAKLLPGDTDDQEVARQLVFDEAWKVEDWVRTTAPLSLTGVAVKLRLLAHPDVGIEHVGHDDDALS